MEMLQLNDLHKTFNPGTVNEKVALNGVSLHMEAGDFATIVGSNGAGKSTLFNAITGGFIADEGSIVLGGQDITFEPEHQRSKVIGHLFQDPLKGTAPNMTIEENLALAYLRAGTAPHAIFSRISRKDKELFREKLSLLDMGLEDRMKQPVGLLSGGQRQALTLLMATLVTPKLLLLDEHTAALDPATAEKVLELTRNIVAEKKITCLMVTHNMHQALELGNRTLMMDAGRVVFDVQGEERSRMTVDDLLEKFRENAGKTLDNDRILLSKVEQKKTVFPKQRKKAPLRALHRGELFSQKLLNVLDGVLEAVLFLQLLDLRLAVLDEGGGVDGSAVVGLLVVLHDLLQLCPALVGLGVVDAVGEVDDELAVFGNACFHDRNLLITVWILKLDLSRNRAQTLYLAGKYYRPYTWRAFSAVVRNTSSAEMPFSWAMYSPT